MILINGHGDLYLTDIGIRRGYNICSSSAVSADNDIGFTIMRTAGAYWSNNRRQPHKVQRRVCGNERAFSDRVEQLSRIDVSAKSSYFSA